MVEWTNRLSRFLQVFEKARAYKARNKSEDVLPVVLLDEVGLAEVSRHNPLKVRLHETRFLFQLS